MGWFRAKSRWSRLTLWCLTAGVLIGATVVATYVGLVHRSAVRRAAIAAVQERRDVSPDWTGPAWLLSAGSDDYLADRFPWAYRRLGRPPSGGWLPDFLRSHVRLDPLLDAFVTVDRVESLSTADLGDLQHLAEVRELQLRDAEDVDALVGFLRRSTGLVELYLDTTSFRNFGGQELPPLPHLERLSLAATEADDAAVESVVGAASNLEWLGLDETRITQATAVRLTRLPKLRTLTLRFCPVTDAWVPEFIRMPELQQVDLRDTAISESAAQQLADAGIEVLMSAEQPQTEAELHEEVRQFFYRKGHTPETHPPE